MPLPHERQPLCPVEDLPAGREVRPRKLVVDRGVEAHLDPAHGVGKQHEPHQADLRVVIHANAGQVGDGVDEPALARGLGLAFQAGALFLSLGEEPLLFDGLVAGVYAIDFGVPKVIVVNIGVAGDRDRSCRRPVVGDADHHDGVRVVRLFVTSVEHCYFLRGERVALRIRARIIAHEQNIHGAVGGAGGNRY